MPVVIAPDFLVNTYPLDYQSDPAITALLDGGFTVSWSAPYQGSAAILARTFSADGVPDSREERISTTPVWDSGRPTVTTLVGGRVVYAWASDDDGSGTGIRARILAADGTFVMAEMGVGGGANNQVYPDVTALSNGRFVVTWSSLDDPQIGNYPSNEFDIHARIYGPGGAPLGNDFVVNARQINSQMHSSVAALLDGRFVVTWYSEEGRSPGDNIRARVFNADGRPVTTDFKVNTYEAGSEGPPVVAALADGRFVVTWYASAGGGRNDIRAAVSDENGTRMGHEFTVNNLRINEQRDADVTALSDGRFLVTWLTRVSGPPGENIQARIFNTNGTAAGAEFRVNTTRAVGQSAPEVTQLNDGRIVVVWRTQVEAGQATEIRSAFIDPDNFQGTAGNDRWTGGTSAERLAGNAGLDVLNGMGGQDTLLGGTGADKLIGGRSRDVLRGDAGADTFDYNSVVETGKTSATRDVILDFAHLQDHIDLHSIDARAGTNVNDSFLFISTAQFQGRAGELRFSRTNLAGTAQDKTLVEADTTGDGRADFQIELTGLVALTAADFYL